MKKLLCMLLVMIISLPFWVLPAFAAGQSSSGVTITVSSSDSGDAGSGDGDTGTGGNESGGDTGTGTGGNESGGDTGTGSGGSGSSGGGGPSAAGDPNKPVDNKLPGEVTGGTDSDGNHYRLIDGITVSESVVAHGYMLGKPGYVFDLEGELTRAEFATIICRVFNYSDPPQVKSFKDVEGHWAEESILTLAGHGVIFGVSSTEFRPDDVLLRDQALLMLGRILYTSAYADSYENIDLGDHYAAEALARMLNVGLYDEFSADYDISAPITRGEMCHIVNNIIYSRGAFSDSNETICREKSLYLDLLNNFDSVYYRSCIKSLDTSYLKGV